MMDDGTINTNGTVECFCCGKQMNNWTYQTPQPDGTVTQVYVHPMGGLHFRTYGHYGSRVFDPMDGKGTSLDLAICDECIVSNITRVYGTGKADAHEVALYENESYREQPSNHINITFEGLTLVENNND